MDLETELGAMDAVSRAIDRVTRRGRLAEFTLTNGIVLGIKPVPPLLMHAVSQEFTPPDPPKVMMEEKGREEPNPNDPQYLKDLQKLEDQQSQALNDLILAVGTHAISVPEGYSMPEDKDWIDAISFAGEVTGKPIEIHTDNKVKRYLCWLRYYALETASDIALATSLPMQLGGIREGEVEEVVESFRRLPERRSDSPGEVEAGNSNGNSANRADRRRSSRARGA